MSDAWRGRWLTLEAGLSLLAAQFLVSFVPLRYWRQSFTHSGGQEGMNSQDVGRLAHHVERASLRLPGKAKCLPQAMALGRMLRRRQVGHSVVLAVRPRTMRDDGNNLHAWVEVGGRIVLGEQPGPWHQLPLPDPE